MGKGKREKGKGKREKGKGKREKESLLSDGQSGIVVSRLQL
jgi:hypothetical protein